MQSKTKTLPVLTLALLATGLSLNAADGDKTEKPKPPTFLTVETAGPDYAVQGEYLNDWGGAQVIALGDDKFRLVTYKGGLPGAGWDKETKNEVEGKRDGAKIVFTGKDDYKAEQAGNKISITIGGSGPYTMEKTSRTSPTLGATPPAGAVVLFDGKSADEWSDGHLDDRGLLAAGATSKRTFQNFALHVEFLLPFKPLGRGQDRGNSGVYFQDRYELQVLDSFGLKGENNECGGIYTKAKPAVNMCFPPLVWQTYDIDFEAAKFAADGKKTRNAVVTVKQNGILIHDKFEINGSTGGGKPEAATPGPIQLQGHGNPVFYRNIWVVEK
jgi:3-keto-disaccharide hydrolase